MNHRILPVLLLSLLPLAGCGNGGRTPLVLYSPHGRDLLSLFEKTYEKSHPDIDVRWLDMGSQEVYDRIRSEKANPQADVWFGGPDTIFARGAKEGLLAPYRPSWADHVPTTSQGPDNLYCGLFLALPILVYNSAAVPADQAPKDWDDLLDPRWKGKVVIRDPLASGTMRTVFGMILARSVAETGSPDAGFTWLRRLDGQTKEYVQNPALLFAELTRQEGLVSIWELTDILLLQRKNAPLAYRFASSGTPVINDAIGLVAHAPHAAQAKAFIDWAGSPEALRLAAEKVFRIPARRDLTAKQLPQWAIEVLHTMRPAQVDHQLMARQGAAWMARWDREVRGHGAP